MYGVCASCPLFSVWIVKFQLNISEIEEGTFKWPSCSNFSISHSVSLHIDSVRNLKNKLRKKDFIFPYKYSYDLICNVCFGRVIELLNYEGLI